MKKIAAIILILLILLTGSTLAQQENKDEGITISQLYLVQPGDSLYKLAQKYGTTIELIKEINNLNSNMIYIGQYLKIPAGNDNPDNIYIIQPGDSLFKLALKFNTTVEKLKELNNLRTDIIYAGDKLIITDKKGEETKTISLSGKVTISNKTLKISKAEGAKITTEMVSALNTGSPGKDIDYQDIIVKYKPLISSQSMSKLEEEIGVTGIESLNRSGKTFRRYRIPNNQDPENIIRELKKRNQVEWVEPNYKYYPTAIPSDRYYHNQQWNFRSINMEAAWDQEKGADDIMVAVLDTGIIKNHPDLKDNLLPGANFVGGDNEYPISSYEKTDSDPSDDTTLIEGGSHGTHVAGIIGAVTNNYRGIAGLNWKVKILPVRVIKKSGGTNWDLVEGIYYSIDRGADIINFSLGSTARSHFTEEALQEAVENGITVIAAAGNNNNDKVYYPAAFKDVIAVGAVDASNEKASYSNYGPEIDVVAPGGGYGNSIYSTWGYYDPENRTSVSSYGGMIGTSMATPHVSGLAALLIANGIEEPGEIRSRLIDTAVDLGPQGKDPYYGFGLIDGYAALIGKKLDNPRVFAGVENNQNIKIKTSMITVNENGTFRLKDLKPGEYKIFGWRDVNKNKIIDSGDYFGSFPDKPQKFVEEKQKVEFEISYISDPGFQKIIEK